MANISFIVTNSGTINAVANSKAYTVPRDHRNYDDIKKAIMEDDVDTLERLVNITKTVQDYISGGVKIKDGVVYYEGNPIHNSLTERILTYMREGFPFQPMLNFLKNLQLNPSFRALNELYPFLEHRGMPITEDGCFLGYKAVNSDYRDKHSDTYDNKVGQVHRIARNTVDDNWRLDCSNGFHVGSLEYVRSFAQDGDHIMIVKVNPADVVSVPPNEVTKLRTCAYEVVGEYDYDKLKQGVYMSEAVHTASGQPVTPGGNGGYGYQEYRDTPSEDDEDEDYDSDLESGDSDLDEDEDSDLENDTY